MPNNIADQLFGYDPNALAQQQDAEAIRYASMSPMQQANYAIYRGAAGLTGAGMEAAGYQPKGKITDEIRSMVLQNINQNDPTELLKGARLLNQMGDTKGATLLYQNARDLDSNVTVIGTSGGYPVYANKDGNNQYIWKDGQKIPFSGRLDMKSDSGSGRAMPASIYDKMTNMAESLNKSTQIQLDTAAWAKKIREGKLNLGLIENVSGKLAVKAGIGGAQAVELANFVTFIEELRGNKLLLAKGTQTATDAQQMLDQIVSSVSDPKYVVTRMDAIGKNAGEAARIAKLNLSAYKRNYGDEAFNIEDYTSKSSAYDVDASESLKPTKSGASSDLAALAKAELERRKKGK